MFLTNSALLTLCAPLNEDAPASEQLLHDQFGMKVFEWDDADGASTEFHLPHGARRWPSEEIWVAVRASG